MAIDRERIQQSDAQLSGQPGTVDVSAFRNRLLNAWKELPRWELRSGDQSYWFDEIERAFANINGSRYRKPDDFGFGSKENIRTSLAAAGTYGSLAKQLRNLLYAFEEVGRHELTYAFVAAARRAIDMTAGVDLRIEVHDGQIELMRSGVAVLDDEVVDPATEWLRAYPDVRKEFRRAVQIVSERDRDSYRHAQDALRFGLEKLLKIVVGDRRLEDQSKYVKEWLAARGVHEDLRNTIVGVMNLIFKEYQNTAVKHDNRVNAGAEKSWYDFEVEYLIYQFATLVRVIAEAARRQPE